MTLLARFLQVLLSLCFGIYGCLADEDIFLPSDSGSGPLFPLENTGGGTQLSSSPDSAASVSDDPASAIFPLGDISTFLLSDVDDSESDLFGTESIANSPLDELTSSNEGFQVDDPGSNFDGLFANSRASCVSDAGGQFIDRIRRRREGETCINPTVFKDPTTDSDENLPPNPDKIFPPPGSNPGRLPGVWNDPKPRPPTTFRAVNTDFDFEYCPAGMYGYRTYAVCDSGVEKDRVPTGLFYSLYHVSRCRFNFFFIFFPPCIKKSSLFALRYCVVRLTKDNRQ